KKINSGDTISFGENHENIFAVHEKGKEIKKEDVKNHIENAGHQVSDEEFQKILKELKLEEKLVRGLFVGLLTIAIFLSGTIFYLNSQNQMVSKKIYQELFSKDKQIQELKDLVGENPQDNADCDPNLDEDCDEIEQVDLFTQIAELEEKNKKLEEKIKKSGSESQKILEEKIAKLEDKIAESEEKGTKLNFDEETKKELSKIISGIVEQINSVKPDENEENNNEEELQKITELENKIAEIQKNLSGEELNFGENGEKVGQAVKILLNKIMQLQNEIKDLKK
ncbi:hypothetical protein LR002_02345, partial [Candidatus Gracilibacteria bacterium]|nr:hypothetical protein [Candidatus Gracilibacteria bacterium]